MSCHKHLTIRERESILQLLAEGKNSTEIARKLNRHKSTISRELKRNTTKSGYSPSVATENYYKNRKECGRKPILRENKALAQTIRRFIIDAQWSPEEISNRLRFEGEFCVSYNTIYRAIKKGILNEKGEKKAKGKYPLQKKLRRKGKKKLSAETRGHMKISNPIEDRPISATNRSRFGHFEIDTVCGKKSKSCIVDAVDRKSRFLIAGKCEKQTDAHVKKVLSELLKPYAGSNKLRSITCDRGKEFTSHKWVSAELGNIPFYFANPSSPWERGTNENTNGLLREYIPKKTDIDLVSDEDLANFVKKINLRPRKCLQWKTPFEVFFNVKLHLT